MKYVKKKNVNKLYLHDILYRLFINLIDLMFLYINIYLAGNYF